MAVVLNSTHVRTCRRACVCTWSSLLDPTHTARIAYTATHTVEVWSGLVYIPSYMPLWCSCALLTCCIGTSNCSSTANWPSVGRANQSCWLESRTSVATPRCNAGRVRVILLYFQDTCLCCQLEMWGVGKCGGLLLGSFLIPCPAHPDFSSDAIVLLWVQF